MFGSFNPTTLEKRNPSFDLCMFSAWVVRQHIYCIMLFRKDPLHGQEVPALQEMSTWWFERRFFLFQRSDSI